MQYTLIDKPRGARVYSIDKIIPESSFSTELLSHEITDTETVIKISYKNEKELKAELEDMAMREKVERLGKLLDTLTTQTTTAPQGTREWRLSRAGMVTSSKNIFTSTGKPIPTLSTYVAEKAVEVFTISHLNDKEFVEEVERSDSDIVGYIVGEDGGEAPTHLMSRGTEYEERAAYEYSLLKGCVCREVPFKYINGFPIGTSVDRECEDFSGEKWYIEIKSPKLKTYAKHLRTKHLIKDYYSQLQVHMLVLGVEWIDFVVFYPKMKLVVDRVDRDMEYISNMIETLELYSNMLREQLELLERAYLG
jgi:hypothetical protein